MTMSFEEFLRWAVTPAGIGLIIGFLVSFAVEYWPAFEGFAPKQKRLIVMAFCFAIPLVATGLGVLMLGWVADFQATFWPALVAGFTAWYGSQAAHLRKLEV